MKTAFSTLCCPNWSFGEIISSAADLGFNGIEFRGVGNEIYTPRVKEFTAENLEQTRQRLSSAGVSIPVFTSGALISNVKLAETALKEAYDYIDLCALFSVPYVRVLADKNAAPSGDVNEEEAVKNLKTIADYAKEKGVSVLVETNGVYACSDNLLRLLKAVNKDNLFVIWDIHHTYRYGAENPDVTITKLGNFIKHVHLKDSLILNSEVKYRFLGDGDIPIKEVLSLLKGIGYDGYLCLEWVKRWASDLAEAEIALPNFLYYIKDVLHSL